jgi:hypothetical protein
MSNQIIVCRICGAPYQFQNMTVADQSCCSECRAARRQAMDEPTEEQKSNREKRRRVAFQ